MQIGDVITKINGEDAQRATLGDLAGKTVELTVKREDKETEISMTVGSRDETAYVLAELPQATAQQSKIREGWLKTGQ